MFVKSNLLTNAKKLPEFSKPQCPSEHYQRAAVQTQTRTRLVQSHLHDTDIPCVQGYSFLVYACGPSPQSSSHSFLSQFSTSSGSCYECPLSSYRPCSKQKRSPTLYFAWNSVNPSRKITTSWAMSLPSRIFFRVSAYSFNCFQPLNRHRR